MPAAITWSEIAIRLTGAILAGLLIGSNRSEHGRAAGLRTTALVSLAACISMIQVNLLLPLAGKSSNSFIVMDLMRLPLGILSGMGFIGAGAILRRDRLIIGVTTAASMWFVTVIGLCFGGGQISLGAAGTAIGFIVLSGLKPIENRMTRDRLATLMIVTTSAGPLEDEIRAALEQGGFKIASSGLAVTADDCTLNCTLQWRAKPSDTRVPEIVRGLAERSGVLRLAWTPEAR
jgi:putative Mg2+ transporter-C (MgtC) family protein